MIGLDTNVLVRLFVDDDVAQSELARAFVRDHCSPENPAFVDRVALCEMVCVLTSAHGYDRYQIADVLEALTAGVDIVVEDVDAVRRAVPIFRRHGVEFADILIAEINRTRGCDATATFDRRASRLDGFVLLQ